MGIYDDIYCDMPLPNRFKPFNSFQTKSLENQLIKYRITAEGQLLRESEGGLDDTPIAPGEVIHFHGIIRFNEYEAKFTDGICVEIRLVEKRLFGQPVAKQITDLPDGLTFDTATRVISGTPTEDSQEGQSSKL